MDQYVQELNSLMTLRPGTNVKNLIEIRWKILFHAISYPLIKLDFLPHELYYFL
jgi:hypothetical protein